MQLGIKCSPMVHLGARRLVAQNKSIWSPEIHFFGIFSGVFRINLSPKSTLGACDVSYFMLSRAVPLFTGRLD